MPPIFCIELLQSEDGGTASSDEAIRPLVYIHSTKGIKNHKEKTLTPRGPLPGSYNVAKDFGNYGRLWEKTKCYFIMPKSK